MTERPTSKIRLKFTHKWEVGQTETLIAMWVRDQGGKLPGDMPLFLIEWAESKQVGWLTVEQQFYEDHKELFVHMPKNQVIQRQLS